MPSEPSVANVNEFIEFTGADRSIAVRFLNRYFNVTQAVEGYFNNDGRLPQEDTGGGWSEQQFHGERMFGPENKPSASFQVHAEDSVNTLGPNIFQTNNWSQSRPPSRADNPMTIEDDAEMQKALQMSMDQDANGQENGTTDGSNFRPAERPYYAEEQWGMVRTTSVVPNPDPIQRKRPPGAPAFMKPAPRHNYLPALLTILHEIPMAKEALLARDATLQDYGIGEDWWDGEQIQIRRVMRTEEEVPLDHSVPVVVETQRIMAFLELTERAYGNTAVLGELVERENQDNDDNTAEHLFLHMWRNQIEQALPDYELSRTFTTHALTEKASPPAEMSEEQIFSIIKLHGPNTDPKPSLLSDDEGCTLYDSIDGALWGAWNPEMPDWTYLEFADVITFDLEHNYNNQIGSTGPILAPAELYVDRYLQENKEKTRQMLIDKLSLSQQIDELDNAQARLKSVQDTESLNKSYDARELLKVVKPFYLGEPSVEDVEEEWMSECTGLSLEKMKVIGNELQQVADRVMERFEALEKSKQKLAKDIRELMNLYKTPSDSVEDSPTHRYTLRGAAADANTTFVLADPNSTEDLIDTSVENWQWWKIVYDKDQLDPISYEKTDEDLVLATIKNPETKKVLLIYASDEAVNFQREPLPKQLKNFVRADNLTFSEELDRSHDRPSPNKRKVADSWDSFRNDDPPWGGSESGDSTTAEAGDDDNTPALMPESNENSPPPYSRHQTEPPPVPPRAAPNKRPAVIPENAASAMHIENIGTNSITDDGFKDVDLLDTPPSMPSQPEPSLGAGGTSDVAMGNADSNIHLAEMQELHVDPRTLEIGNEDLMQL